MSSSAESETRSLLLVGFPDSRCGELISEISGRWKTELKSPWAILSEGECSDLVSSDAVLLDLESFPVDVRWDTSRRVLEQLRRLDPTLKPIAMVAPGDLKLAGAVANWGAWDVLTLDENGVDERLRASARVRRLQALSAGAHNAGAVKSLPRGEAGPAEMIGLSRRMQPVLSLIRRVAATDVPVLITGESGTGKELAALTIHERSRRAGRPFIPINCAAIPEALLEAELFGHERGAFTGAARTRRGRFEVADGGTLLLDEICELPHHLQVKLLRFLEDHVVERVGGNLRIPVDVRVLAATNRDLSLAVANGGFREDLYYRIAVFPIELPPLRERGEDVIVLARHFLACYAAEGGKSVQGFSRDAVQAIARGAWPGNVRELINRVRRAVVVADGPKVTASDLGLESSGTAGEGADTSLREARAQAESDSLRQALCRSGGNRSEAARSLRISRTQFYELLHRYKLMDSDLR